jgi:hypothetical protein
MLSAEKRKPNVRRVYPNKTAQRNLVSVRLRDDKRPRTHINATVPFVHTGYGSAALSAAA